MEKTCVNCRIQFIKKVSKGTIKPFCSMKCYGVWQKGKSFQEQEKKTKKTRFCSLDGCGLIHFGKGFCRKHYIKIEYNPRYGIKERIKGPVILDCALCNKKFRVHRGRSESAKYCSSICSGAHRRKHHILKKGYKKLLIQDHPRADKKGYVFEHIIVMEKIISRPLDKNEVIHHIDHDKKNNSPENLLLCKNHSEHMKYHNK